MKEWLGDERSRTCGDTKEPRLLNEFVGGIRSFRLSLGKNRIHERMILKVFLLRNTFCVRRERAKINLTSSGEGRREKFFVSAEIEAHPSSLSSYSLLFFSGFRSHDTPVRLRVYLFFPSPSVPDSIIWLSLNRFHPPLPIALLRPAMCYHRPSIVSIFQGSWL